MKMCRYYRGKKNKMIDLQDAILTEIATRYPLPIQEVKKIYGICKSYDLTIKAIELSVSKAINCYESLKEVGLIGWTRIQDEIPKINQSVLISYDTVVFQSSLLSYRIEEQNNKNWLGQICTHKIEHFEWKNYPRYTKPFKNEA